MFFFLIFVLQDRFDFIGGDVKICFGRVKCKVKDVEGGLKEFFKRKWLFKFWCDFCSVGVCNEIVMRNYELGKKYKVVIKKQFEKMVVLIFVIIVFVFFVVL